MESAAESSRPAQTESTNMVMLAMAEMPAARPSRPSMRFTALVIPTIHSTVTGTDSQFSTQ